MVKYFNHITEKVGNTPIIKLNKIAKDLPANVFVKVESFNPLSSIKDRVGAALIEDGEKKGFIKQGTTIIEPTSGNTGIALAFVCAVKGYKLILTMPESMSIERRRLLKALGAEVELTQGSKSMAGAIEKAYELKETIKNSYIPGQFTNPANSMVHKKTTAVEIWNDMEGRVDCFVCGVGTGGTITGVGEFLKGQNENIKVAAVEPEESAVLSGKKAGPHSIQGIGAGFVPEILNAAIIDEYIAVSGDDAGNAARALAVQEGIFGGISSGANLWAALKIAKRKENKNKNIVTVIADTGERYLSTWLFMGGI
ncbi:MAG: cysteine synthase A [Endomicrobiaceae bacterium]|jgi:cysteine synthase A|nr:cysteine synthase A [Endomicrobiaceae bacterium]MDD3730235.1 cysteine synthase A [Endomicrobiaceae bacterium]MDD4165767.1 cysteine synthase A [Endomicrobiaceae bacterium]